MNQKIETAAGFVAVITPEFIRRKDEKMKDCQDAIEANKPMYAIVKKGTKWAEFEQLPWRQVFFFSDFSEIQSIFIKIQGDLNSFKKVQEFK